MRLCPVRCSERALKLLGVVPACCAISVRFACYFNLEVHFDTALNLVWLLLGFFTLGSVGHAIFFRKAKETRQSKRLHVVGLGLIVIALFPYISATDDVLRIEHYQSQSQIAQEQVKEHSSTSSKGHSQMDDLLRLYEVMDSPLICRVCEISLTFIFIAFLFSRSIRLIDLSAPGCAGRSPPAF